MSIAAPLRPPLKSGFLNQKASRATASDSVTTATGRPRMRRAGSPTTTPMAMATTADSSGASGNGTSQFMANRCREYAPTPASESWARDTWPA